MNIAVNGRFLSRRVTGVERYGLEILRCLGTRLRIVRSRPGRWARGIPGHAWEQFSLPGQILPNEILWSPANAGPLAAKKQVLTLHDLSPLEHPDWFAPSFALWYQLFLPALARRVQQVTVPSTFVRGKVLRRLALSAGQVTVVSAGVDLQRFRPGIQLSDDLPEHYVLFVGSVQPRKNLRVLLHAWELICKRFSEVWLVVAGTRDNAIFRQEALPARLERVCWLGYVADDDLPGLYAGAQVLVLPSLDEGFGMPLLEAMACGTAVIAARAGALPEVAGDSARYFDPTQATELAEVLGQFLRDETMRRAFVEKGLIHVQTYSWEQSAEKLWKVMQKCQ